MSVAVRCTAIRRGGERGLAVGAFWILVASALLWLGSGPTGIHAWLQVLFACVGLAVVADVGLFDLGTGLFRLAVCSTLFGCCVLIAARSGWHLWHYQVTWGIGTMSFVFLAGLGSGLIVQSIGLGSGNRTWQAAILVIVLFTWQLASFGLARVAEPFWFEGRSSKAIPWTSWDLWLMQVRSIFGWMLSTSFLALSVLPTKKDLARWPAG